MIHLQEKSSVVFGSLGIFDKQVDETSSGTMLARHVNLVFSHQ